jgi:hypothetical protein
VVRSDQTGTARWLRIVTQLLIPALTATGVSVGTRQADLSDLAAVREELRTHERIDTAIHAELTRLLAIDNGGFSDPRMLYALDAAIKRGIEHLQTRADVQRWRKQVLQLNPTLVLPAGE